MASGGAAAELQSPPEKKEKVSFPCEFDPKKEEEEDDDLAFISPPESKSIGNGEEEDEDEDEDEEEEEEEDADAAYERIMAKNPPHVFDPDKDRGMSEEDYKKYIDQCVKSEGYNVDYYPIDDDLCGIISPLNLNKSESGFVKEAIECSKLALSENEGSNCTFEGIVRANVQVACGFLYYITFAAKDANGRLVNFQARVQSSHRGRDIQDFRKEALGRKL